MIPHFYILDIFIAAALHAAAIFFDSLVDSIWRASEIVPTNGAFTRDILLRLFSVFVFETLLCYLGNIALWFSIAFLAGFLFLGWCLSEIIPSVVWNPGIIFLYIIQQYVLGFPDRDDWILPPTNAETTWRSRPHLDALIGIHGETLSVLKPMGQVLVNGGRFDAISDTGALIGIEATVVVSAVNGDKLVVRESRSI